MSLHKIYVDVPEEKVKRPRMGKNGTNGVVRYLNHKILLIFAYFFYRFCFYFHLIITVSF